MTTSADVANEAHVSQATVSRVVNGDSRVAEETRSRVLAAIQRLEYTPNEIARSLVSQRSTLVAVVVSDLTNPFYPELLDAIGSGLASAGLKMVLVNAYGLDESAYVQLILSQRVDGVILTTVSQESSVIDQLCDRGIAVVLVNRYVDGCRADAAVGDNRSGAVVAAEHLHALGHRRIAVVAGSKSASTSADRVDAFCSRLASLGSPVPEEWILEGSFEEKQASIRVRAVLAGSAPPSAIFAVNDVMAFGVLNAAHQIGVSVPDELSVVGFDDVDMSSWASFDLTTVRQPVAEMARASVDLLTERIADSTRGFRKIVFPSNLVVRGTTARTHSILDEKEMDRDAEIGSAVDG